MTGDRFCSLAAEAEHRLLGDAISRTPGLPQENAVA